MNHPNLDHAYDVLVQYLRSTSPAFSGDIAVDCATVIPDQLVEIIWHRPPNKPKHYVRITFAEWEKYSKKAFVIFTPKNLVGAVIRFSYGDGVRYASVIKDDGGDTILAQSILSESRYRLSRRRVDFVHPDALDWQHPLEHGMTRDKIEKIKAHWKSTGILMGTMMEGGWEYE